MRTRLAAIDANVDVPAAVFFSSAAAPVEPSTAAVLGNSLTASSCAPPYAHHRKLHSISIAEVIKKC